MAIDYASLTPVVERAAKRALSSYPEHHDIEDVQQELWVWVMENEGTVEGIARDSKGTLAALEGLLLKTARTHLQREDAAAYGYAPEEQYNYSIGLIKKILEVVFRHEDWQSFAIALDAMPKGKVNHATGGNNLASYADVSSAVERLSDDHYNLLVWRYKYQYTFEQIGLETGTSRQAARERHETAVKAVQTFLGRIPQADLRRGYEGRTGPSSNASARARTERDYEG